VIPHTTLEPLFEVPMDARLPHDDEVDEEGFGFFRGVWVIGPTPFDEIGAIAAWETGAVDAVGRCAATPDEFDSIARVLEYQVFDEPVDLARDYPGLTPGARSILEPHIVDAAEMLDGLDLGMASLVLVLNTAGFMTAASCRGHVGSTAWTESPVVHLAGERGHLLALRDDVLAVGGGLERSGNGKGLVRLCLPSVSSAMELAHRVRRLCEPGER
jgi:hypothetical protein